MTPGPLVLYQSDATLAATTPMTARLSADQDGSPLPGRTVHFRAGKAELCSAVTDATGTASCGGTPEWVQAATTGGYTAVFDGDAFYAGSRGLSPLRR